jgi:hypothetical protein
MATLKPPRVLTGPAFAKALADAGVVEDLDSIERIVIDVQAHDFVRVYVQRVGDERIAVAAGILGTLLADATVLERKGVRYWVCVSDVLLHGPSDWKSAGLQLIEVGDEDGIGSHWCLFEDRDAPAELDGKKVALTIARGRQTEDGPDLPLHVTERRVIGLWPRRR